MRPMHTRDRGAAAIEYAGILILVTAVLATLLSVGLPQTISTHVTHSICQILQAKNCGPTQPPGHPTAQQSGEQSTRDNGSAPSRFTHGFFHGLGNTFGVSPASRPVDPPTDPGKVWPGAGGPQNDTVDHNIIVYDTRSLIEQMKDEYVDDGVVSIDCGPAGHTANCIPGAAKNGKGGNGYADIILTGRDKGTGKPVVYVWEVKTSARQGEATGQLARYIDFKSRRVPPGTEVRYGFGLPTRTGIPGSGSRVLRSWSKGSTTDRNNPLRGVRLYNEDKKRRSERQPQEQPQHQPQEHPLLCQPRPPLASINGCLTLPGLNQPQIPDTSPEPDQGPQPQQPEEPAEPEPVFEPPYIPEPIPG